MADRKKAAIAIGVGAGIAGLIYVATRAKAAPPKVYTCSVCGAEFSTLKEAIKWAVYF